MKKIIISIALLVSFSAIIYSYTKAEEPMKKDVTIIEKSELKNYSLTSSAEGNLAIAFGGGGIRGFAHFGVIKALDEAGIDFNIATGTSAGALAAVLYSSGLSYKEIDMFIDDFLDYDAISFTFDKRGPIDGLAFADMVNKYIKNKTIEDLNRKVGVTVSNYTKAKLNYILEGDAGFSVKMSSTVPGTFQPVEINGDLYLDGGIFSIVPIDMARGLGADYVLGIDLYCTLKNRFPPTNSLVILFGMAAIQSCVISNDEMNRADSLIKIDFNPDKYDSLRNLADAAIEAGYSQTKLLIPEIKAKIKLKIDK